MITANIINNMSIHCTNKTCSFKRKKDIKTETGNSNPITILPKPIPVKVKTLFNKNKKPPLYSDGFLIEPAEGLEPTTC
jgi:hypothetical protein